MKYNGVDFNEAVVLEMTEQEFVTHRMHENHYTHLADEEKRKLLTKIYQWIIEKNNKGT